MRKIIINGHGFGLTLAALPHPDSEMPKLELRDGWVIIHELEKMTAYPASRITDVQEIYT